MTAANRVPQPAHAPVQWQRESSGRRSRSESDAWEVDVERYSTDGHAHVYAWTPAYPAEIAEALGALRMCIYCAGWEERIEGRIQ
jgi:hypothetical protein